MSPATRAVVQNRLIIMRLAYQAAGRCDLSPPVTVTHHHRLCEPALRKIWGPVNCGASENMKLTFDVRVTTTDAHVRILVDRASSGELKNASRTLRPLKIIGLDGQSIDSKDIGPTAIYTG